MEERGVHFCTQPSLWEQEGGTAPQPIASAATVTDPT